jgi:hypothetical protein
MNTFDPTTPPPEGGETGDAMNAQAKVWPHVQVTVEYWAGRLSTRRAEREQLIQDARVELLRMDAARCNIRDREDVLVLRRKLENCIKDSAKARRRELTN